MRAAVLDGLLERVELRRAPGRPEQVHLSVTDRCFLPCTHCDIWKNRDQDLPGAVWIDLIDRLGDWCAPASMNFVGGEPLLRRDLEELLGHARNRGFQTSFNTNGWLIDEDRARTVASSGVGTVYVSLDGIHAETVDATRGREGSHERAVRAIELLDAQVGPQVVVACIIHGRNAREIPELLAWVRARGLQLVVQPLYQNFGHVEYDPQWWRSSPLWPCEEDLAPLEAALDLLVAERLRGGPVCNSALQLHAMKAHFRYPDRNMGLTCRAGHSDISFDPQGNVRLCYFLEPVGNMFDNSPLPVLWSALPALRRRHQVSRCERHCGLLNCNAERAI